MTEKYRATGNLLDVAVRSGERDVTDPASKNNPHSGASNYLLLLVNPLGPVKFTNKNISQMWSQFGHHQLIVSDRIEEVWKFGVSFKANPKIKSTQSCLV